jgi:translocation and assembly module TamB
VDDKERVERVEAPTRRRRRWPYAVSSILVVLLIGLLALWLLRFTIAADFIDREFAKRGVQATYSVKRIGFRRQRIENLVIGDPRAPDLTARWVEIELDWGGFTLPDVALIRARGVRLRGRIVGGRISLGEVDKMLPPPSGLPFRLPDQRVDIADSAIRLETPGGVVGIGLHGRGNLSNGFRGHMAAVSRGLAFGECRIAAPSASLTIGVDALRPSFRGPVASPSVSCEDGFALDQARFDIAATLAPALDSWRGSARLAARRFVAGPARLAGMGGSIAFDGNFEGTRGRLDIGSEAAAVGSVRSASTRVVADYAVVPRSGALELDGEASLLGLVLARPAIASVEGPLRALGGIPVEPIGEALADALARAATGGADLRGHLAISNNEGQGAARFRELQLVSRSGARLRATGGSGITYRWPGGALQTDGDFALSGGGFPNARFTLRQPRAGGPVEGVGEISPMRAGDARLALGRLRFAALPDGTTRVETTAMMDGNLFGTRVQGLALPVRARFGRGGFALGEACVPASFRRLTFQTLTLGPSRLTLCPSGRAMVWKAPGAAVQGGIELRAPRFAGRFGETPIAVDARRLRFGVGDKSFVASGADIRLGAAPVVHDLRIAELSGRFVPGGVTGAYSGLSGKIANVPLLISQGAGSWRVLNGKLDMAGRILVDDAQAEPRRFETLVSDDFRLTLADNRIAASGWLKHPPSGIRVLHATIAHDLGSGTGHADLDVPGIRFTLDGLQPEDITPLTVGVVALVDGTLTGEGRIDWSPGATTSSGTFSTHGMNLAAPFGPVEGLTTTVHFTDLLALESAPHQIARIDMIRAGIDIPNGHIRYQILPGSRISIERGAWPFSGGELLLEPTLLDFSQPSTRHLRFQLVGFDAQRFMRDMGFTTIEVTGIFDGVIPMEIDSQGARVVGGRLVARPGGGRLAYTGPIDRANMPLQGRIAFDALGDLRYRSFEMDLDGALAGEFVGRIRLEGLSSASRNWIVRQFRRVPFQFNITVRGPLRAVIASIRATKDPTLLIQPVLPPELQELPTSVTTIQKEESEAPQ